MAAKQRAFCHFVCKKNRKQNARAARYLAAAVQAMPPPVAALLPRPKNPTRQHGRALCWLLLSCPQGYLSCRQSGRVFTCWSHGGSVLRCAHRNDVRVKFRLSITTYRRTWLAKPRAINCARLRQLRKAKKHISQNNGKQKTFAFLCATSL